MRATYTRLVLAFASILAKARSQTGSSTLPTLVQPTPTSIGNASDIKTYPLCAQSCNNETAPFLGRAIPGCDEFKLECVCSAYFRSETARCEEVSCSAADYQTTQKLAQQLCGPLYANNDALSTSAASAIASATAAAAANVVGKNVLNLADYPACAQQCSKEYNNGGCGIGSTNTTCICNPPASMILGNCEVANCSDSDLAIVSDLSFKLCAPAGGVNEGANVTGILTAANKTRGAPAPATFTGGTKSFVADHGTWALLAMIGIFTGAMMA